MSKTQKVGIAILGAGVCIGLIIGLKEKEKIQKYLNEKVFKKS